MEADAKYVIFDLDGTLIDSFETVVANCKSALEYMKGDGISFDFSAYRKKDLRNLFSDIASFEDIELDAFKRLYDTFYTENCFEGTCVVESASDLLGKYRECGYKIVVLTDKHQQIAEKICNNLFEGEIDCVIGRMDEKPIKVLHKVTDRLADFGIKPESCVQYLGDSDTDEKCAAWLQIPFQRISIE